MSNLKVGSKVRLVHSSFGAPVGTICELVQIEKDGIHLFKSDVWGSNWFMSSFRYEIIPVKQIEYMVDESFTDIDGDVIDLHYYQDGNLSVVVNGEIVVLKPKEVKRLRKFLNNRYKELNQ